MSDSVSLDAQPNEPVTPLIVSQQSEHCGDISGTSYKIAQSSTSKGILPDTPAEQNETIIVNATTEEMRTTIDALLSLGSDLQFGLDVKKIDNKILQPIAPDNILPDPTPMISEINSDDTEILDEHVALDEENNHDEPLQIESDTKPEKKKGQLVFQSFQLTYNQRPACKFSCVGCPQKFPNNKDLNIHFRTAHSPLTCVVTVKNYSPQVQIL